MPVAVPIDNAQIKTGPGKIYFAPIGSDLPAMTVTGGVFTDAWPVAWLEAGPTDSGIETGHSTDTDTIEVEESLYPVRVETTGKSDTVSFALVNDNPRTLKLALNGGTVVVTGTAGTTLTKYSPPLIGAETRVMIGWEANDSKTRVLFYQCFQQGSVSPARRKGANKVVYEMEFAVELPAPAVSAVPWNRWDAGAGVIL